MNMNAAYVCFVILYCFGAAMADDLPRRANLGVALGPTEAQRGVKITEVSPESAAFYAGIEAGDVLQKIGSVQLLGPDAVSHAVSALGAQEAGEAVLLTVTKGTYTSHMTIELPELPRETHPDFETIYDSVEVDGTRLRTIVTKPEGEGPFPAVFFIQRLGCTSVEAPTDPDDPVRRLLSGFTKAGYVTLRVEKRGMGDSEGAPCSELDFVSERAGYAAGLAHLKSLPYVDSGNLYLFGDGMGGVFALSLATEEPVAALITYDLPAEPNRDSVEAAESRHDLFWEQLAELDLPALRADVDVPALSITRRSDTRDLPDETILSEILAWITAR